MIPLNNQTTEAISKTLVEQFILIHGVPTLIISDCGQSFLSKLMVDICKLLNIKKSKTLAYMPSNNGRSKL